jgi:hypothetical protein
MNWVFTREIKLSRLVVEPVSLLSLSCGSSGLQYNINLLYVTNLTISGEFDNQVDFAYIINRCVNLRRLDVCNILPDDCINDRLFARIININKLVEIRVNEILSDANQLTWQILATKCSNLEYVSLSVSTDYNDRSSNVHYGQYIVSLLANNQKIKRIDLDTFDLERSLNEFEIKVTFDMLAILACYCPIDIECINLQCYTIINAEQFVKLLTYYNKLKLLDIQQFDKFFWPHCKKVVYYREFYRDSCSFKHISVSGFADTYNYTGTPISNINFLFDSINGFTYIIIKHIVDLSDSFLRQIANKNCTTLLHLIVGTCGDKFTSDVICDVLTLCKHLTSLHLLDCCHFNNSDFIAICSPANVLIEFSINNSKKLITSTLLKLVDRSKQLVMLNIHECFNVHWFDIQNMSGRAGLFVNDGRLLFSNFYAPNNVI